MEHRWRVLCDLENDPYDAGYFELSELLEAWEITEPVDGADVPGHVARYHPDVGEAMAVYFPTDETLPASQVKGICRQVRRIAEILEGDNGRTGNAP